jgi:hypothetical protein
LPEDDEGRPAVALGFCYSVGYIANAGAREIELKELFTYVRETSPVRDVLANGVPVSTSIEVPS